MARPPLEVADLVRVAGDAFIERNRHWLRWKHIEVLLAIRRCRTAALGGHLDTPIDTKVVWNACKEAAQRAGLQKLGGLLETSLRWPRICAALSGPLHSPCGHLQPPPGLLHRWPSHFSLA